MAKAVKTQISQFAREIFTSHAAAASSSQAEAQIQQIDIDSIMDDQTWLDELSYLGPNGNSMILERATAEPLSMAAVVLATNTF